MQNSCPEGIIVRISHMESLNQIFFYCKSWNCSKFSSNPLQLQCFQQFIAKVSLNVSFSLNYYSRVRNRFNDILNLELFNFETCSQLFLKHTDYNICLSSIIILTSYLRHQNMKKIISRLILLCQITDNFSLSEILNFKVSQKKRRFNLCIKYRISGKSN